MIYFSILLSFIYHFAKCIVIDNPILSKLEIPLKTFSEKTGLFGEIEVGGQNIEFKLTFYSPYSILYNYNPQDMNSYHEESKSLKINKIDLTTKMCTDKAFFITEHLTDRKFPFLLAQNNKRQVLGSLGLSYEDVGDEYNKYSFLHHLKSRRIVPLNVFYIQYKDNQNAKIVFGALPKEYSNDKAHFHIHKMIQNEKDNFYNVHIDSIFVSSNRDYNNQRIIEVNKDFQFNIESNLNFLSIELFNFIAESLFKNAFNANICSIQVDLGIYFYYIICKQSFIEDIEINFVFDTWTYKLNGEDLWERLGKSKIFSFYGVSTGTFSLGLSFLRKYLTIFDNTNSQIIILHNNKNKY